jgi:DNA polymerase
MRRTKNIFDFLITEAEVNPLFINQIKKESSLPCSANTGELLEALALEASLCSRCGLRRSANQVVFGSGHPSARLMMVGEGPGAEEDIQGLPFVGAAGKLLTRILDAAGINRDEVYITNVVKCRPPANRLPQKDEVDLCVSYLLRQIELLKPQIIVCLGSLSTQVLVDPKARITQVRGKWYERGGARVMPTFHPAALLRDAAKKRPVWEDFKQIRDAYRLISERGEPNGQGTGSR